MPASDMVETCLEPRSHPQLIIPTLPTSLELFASTHHLLCVPLCVCYLGFVNWGLRVHNSGLRSLRICELGVASAQFRFALFAGVVCVNGVGNICLPQ